jgi:nanoRNase/pAp phosphatase (c-di-AMP/oligoRNAs hydrolase)
LPAQVRSRHRDVRVWAAGAGDVRDRRFHGDPGDPRTYEWVRDAHGVTAVIDMSTPAAARAALHALRSVRPDAAVLLLSGNVDDLDGLSDGTLARSGELRDVLRLDLDDELQRLEAERRAYCLREFAAGDDVIPILIHNDPDPDAVSSALAVATLLGGRTERTPIVTLDRMTRPENRRMAELLHIRVTRITLDELRRFDRVITVDTQPRGVQVAGRPRLAVIDHHPREHNYEAEFIDIRSEYGATASMMTEYLRAVDEKRVGRALATALLFGIKTDTDSLMRGVTPADVAAYAFLQERADLQLVRRFERPSYSADTARAWGAALAGMLHDDELCVAYLGRLDQEQSHVLADLADFCLAIENATWAAAGAVVDENLIITLRHSGRGPGAGDVARGIAARGGSGGGHASMARVSLPCESMADVLGGGGRSDADVCAAIRQLVADVLAELKEELSRPESLPTHQA